MKKHTLAALIPCAAIICATVVGCFCLTNWLNSETERINANSACFSEAIEFEKSKAKLLELIADGSVEYTDTVQSLVNTKCAIQSDLNADESRTLQSQIKQNRDAIDAFLTQYEQEASHE